MNNHANISDDNFGAVINCAIRYAFGRNTSMPSLVIDFVTPLLPYLSGKTLLCIDKDLAEEFAAGNYPFQGSLWQKFHDNVREIRRGRGEQPYKSWRDQMNELEERNKARR